MLSLRLIFLFLNLFLWIFRRTLFLLLRLLLKLFVLLRNAFQRWLLNGRLALLGLLFFLFRFLICCWSFRRWFFLCLWGLCGWARRFKVLGLGLDGLFASVVRTIFAKKLTRFVWKFVTWRRFWLTFGDCEGRWGHIIRIFLLFTPSFLFPLPLFSRPILFSLSAHFSQMSVLSALTFLLDALSQRLWRQISLHALIFFGSLCFLFCVDRLQFFRHLLSVAPLFLQTLFPFLKILGFPLFAFVVGPLSFFLFLSQVLLEVRLLHFLILHRFLVEIVGVRGCQVIFWGFFRRHFLFLLNWISSFWRLDLISRFRHHRRRLNRLLYRTLNLRF